MLGRLSGSSARPASARAASATSSSSATRAQGVPVYHLTGQAHATVRPARTHPPAPAHLLRDRRARLRPDGARADRRRDCCSSTRTSPRTCPPLRLPGHTGSRATARRMDPEARQRRLLRLMRRLARARRRAGAKRDRDRGPALARPGERGLRREPDSGDRTEPGPRDRQLPPEYHAAWMSGPRTARSRSRRSATGRSAAGRRAVGPDASLAGMVDLVREGP